MTRQTRQFILGVYLAATIATLVFQVAVRSQACAGASNCALSYGKAAVWSVIWPASWAVYLKPHFSDWLRERGYLPKGAA